VPFDGSALGVVQPNFIGLSFVIAGFTEERARQSGFTLDEIRQLFFGFGNVTRASERWQKLSRRKLAELDILMESIKTTRGLLQKMMRKCRCDTLEQCGKGIFRGGCLGNMVKSRPANHRHDK
jgi:hypothetical protein